MAADTSLATFSLGGLYRHGYVYEGVDGRLYISVPERMPALEIVDGYYPVVHESRGGGETLMNIAIRYYKGILGVPLDAWEVVAQFQEDPVLDPFVPLARGRLLQIPPSSFYSSVVYGTPLSEEGPEF